MQLSGTSIAAPVVSGTVALMLQANPGLTPPLIKAILQYTAQPLVGASLVQQGAGSLNVDGAVRLAKALRTDIAGAVAAGTIQPGDNLLASGQSLPEPVSTVNGEIVNWSRVVFAGGSHLLSGTCAIPAIPRLLRSAHRLGRQLDSGVHACLLAEQSCR